MAWLVHRIDKGVLATPAQTARRGLVSVGETSKYESHLDVTTDTPVQFHFPKPRLRQTNRVRTESVPPRRRLWRSNI
jgi:hypothetical protein